MAIPNRLRREIAGTGVEIIQPSFDKKIYEVKKIKLKLLMDKNEQDGLNDTHPYMNAAVNVMFTKIQASRGFKMFEERAAPVMVKELKQSDEGTMPVNKVISEINPNVL